MNQMIISQNQVMLNLLRQIASKVGCGTGTKVPDLLPQPLNTEEELEQLCQWLQDDTYKLNMVHWSAISDCLELVCYVCLTVESKEYSSSSGGVNSTKEPP